MKKMRDLHNFSAKTFKGVLFTGAQATKKLAKAIFNTALRIFQIRGFDILRMIKSEICTKLEQREPKAPCSQAPKQAKAGKSSFSTHL